MYYSVEDTFAFLHLLPRGSIAEFGVFKGNTLNRLIKGAEDKGCPFENVYGFDSWVGIPEEAPNVAHNPEWPVSAFSVCRDFNLSGPEQAMEFVRSNIERKDITLVSGFFSESLTPELGATLTDTVSYAHIDVDLYISTVQVLDWLLTHKIPKIGCLFRYDDWYWHQTPVPEWTAGNSLAHKQACEKYGVRFDRVTNNVFQLTQY